MHLERHAHRIERDALRLGLPRPPRSGIEQLCLETAQAAFGRGDGIVRVEWAAARGGPARLRATTRPLGPMRASWRTRTSHLHHPGPEDRRHTKRIDVEIYDRARREAQAAGVDEVLLCDADGWLVEGGRSSLLVVTVEGDLLTPELALGSVESLGLEIVREATPELREARIDLAALLVARELMAVNAVRGVVPITRLDGVAVGQGIAGPWARRLEPLFAAP
jgi:branched-subunit amino acid aminotransferase/4-amino-4-deoxychorismate lyase